jgi:hypothetical protein
MKKQILPWLILACALGLSGTAAYYSIIGLSLLFSSIAIPVIIMASFLEVSKIIIASLLHSYWKGLNIILRGYLTVSLIVLSLITSLGIYGLLSSGYQDTLNKVNVVGKQIEVLDTKRDRFNESLTYLQSEKQSIDQSISELRNGLANNKVQYRDRQTGEIITTTSSANRKSLENQLDKSTETRDKISDKIVVLQDSISNIDIQILNIESDMELAAELGPLTYISKLTGKSMDSVVNILTMMIIFIFDPLAISLVLAANYAFTLIKPKPQPQPESEPVKPEEPKRQDPPNPIVEKMKSIVNNPSISAWRRNKVKDKLDKGDYTIDYN